MSPPVTDQLEERRKRREARTRAANGNGADVRGQTPKAARDLLNGLITGSDDGDEQQHEHRAPNGHVATGSVDTGAGQPPGPSGGETVQDLVRRVQQEDATRTREASAIVPRRAASTVDLPPSAAGRRRPTRPRLNRIARTNLAAARKQPVRRWAAAAATGAAGIAILSVLGVTALGGGSGPGRLHASTSDAALITEQGDLRGNALSPTIAEITSELQAFARVAVAARRTSHPLRKPRSGRVGRHGGPVQAHSSAVSERLSARASSRGGPGAETHSRSAPAPETQSYTPAATRASSGGHASAGSQTSGASGNQPAGPTGSDPLGGIGSCVSGCT